MIKIDEVRMSNIVYFEREHLCGAINYIDICDGGLMGAELPYANTDKLDRIKFITGAKLSKEVFHCIKGMAHDDSEEFDDFILEMHSIKDLVFEYHPKTNDYSVSRFELNDNDKITKEKSIKYLHELQNLYFALTGEELEIDMEKLNKIKTLRSIG